MKNNLHKEKMEFVSKIFPKRIGSVLDIGCFKGELGKLLIKQGYDYCGLDINTIALKEAKNKGLNVKKCDLDKENISFKKKFDYIVILDVIEHLHNPKKTITNIKQHLKDNGKLIISLPNDFHFINRLRFILGKPILSKPFWAHTHLHIFTKKQAENFLKDFGFRIFKKYELPGTQPKFLSYNKRRLFAKTFPNLLSRTTMYVCGLK